jgi:Cu-Zn family superoxide dismutase
VLRSFLPFVALLFSVACAGAGQPTPTAAPQAATPAASPGALALPSPSALASPSPATFPSPGPADQPRGFAQVKNALNEVVGAAEIVQGANGVAISVKVTMLPPGNHGIHIHEVGKCDPPDFASAGGHLNPERKQHGLENPQGPHAGDLSNLEVGPDGSGSLAVTTNRVTLSGGADSLFGPDGTSLVIHANPDDQRTDPDGNSGARIACGAIARA